MKRTRKKMGKGKSTKVRDLPSDLRRGVDVVLRRTLTSEEEKVLRMRYGLRGDTRTTIEPRAEGPSTRQLGKNHTRIGTKSINQNTSENPEVFLIFQMPSPRIERGFHPPQGCALSVELRGRHFVQDSNN